MNILSKLFKRSEAQTNDQLISLLKGEHHISGAGAAVNHNSAQALPAVYCAVNTIAEAVASMPIHVFKRDTDGQKQRQRTHIIEKLFNLTPNGYQTSYDFKVAMMRSVLLTGNAYAEIVYDRAGRVQKLIPLHPSEVTVKKLSGYRLGYQVTTESPLLT